MSMSAFIFLLYKTRFSSNHSNHALFLFFCQGTLAPWLATLVLLVTLATSVSKVLSWAWVG